MSDSERGQVNKSAAQIYDEFFVPALFQEWTESVLTAANVTAGQTVLDVACGTGVLARAAHEKVGSAGKVIGLDINDGMLNVARSSNTDIEWKQSAVEKLPFEDNTFDAVVSQFGMMFFENRTKAIQEMLRVVKAGQTVVIAVWGSLDETPGYTAMVDLLLRLFGEEAANGLRAPYNLGDKAVLAQVMADAGVSNYDVNTIVGTAKFPSIADWMFTDIKGWVLADSINEEQYELLLSEAEKELQRFVIADGSVAFDAPAHIITITKA